MLEFVGMGVGDSMPIRAESTVRMADLVYLDVFTSPIPNEKISKIKKMAKRLVPAKRWMVEDGNRILDDAKSMRVVLISSGDPYAATTHTELRCRAAMAGIKTGTVHASSIITAAAGECGLHHYKIGMVSTVMRDPKSVVTPYYTIYHNMVRGGHSVVLLEYDHEGGFFLDPSAALGLLRDAESEQRRNTINDNTFAVVASRIGMPDQGILAGSVSELRKKRFGPPPHTVLFPGLLHFTESDALRVLASCEPQENRIKSIPSQMIAKYAPLVRASIGRLRGICGDRPEYGAILENAELYARDAEKNLEDGREEVAILCMGYADGLSDALLMAHGIDPVDD